MPIPVTCDCGRSLRIKDDMAGRKIRCPTCSTVLTVPKADAEEAALQMLLEDAAEPQTGIRPSNWNDSPPRTDALQPPPRTLPPALPKPDVVKKPPKIKRRSKAASGPSLLERLHINGGLTITGLLMMLGAVVWFFGALMLGILFIYPPILFVLGFFTFCRGLMGHNE